MSPTLKQREFAWKAVGYTPSAEQLAAHLDPARVKLVAGGERAGKSFSAAMELFVQVIGSDGLFWICSPDYDQAKPEFEYLLAALQRIGAVQEVSNPRVGARRLITKFGATILTKTTADIRKLAGTAPDGILLVEAAQTAFEIWLKLRGRLVEKRGWLWASGTLENGSPWYSELWSRWQADNPEGGRSFSIPTWANLAVFPGGRDDPEIKAMEATLPHDLFLERYGAVPCPPVGLVFKEFAFAEHVRQIVWRLEVKEAGKVGPKSPTSLMAGMHWPIEIAVDPGYAHAYAVLAFTWLGDQVYVFDEVYERGMVAEEIIARCKAKWWWPKVKGGVIDIAGTQHPGSKSQQEIWRSAAGLYLRGSRVGVVEGILRTRTFFVNPATQKPRLFIDPACKGLLAELGKYRYHRNASQRPNSELPIDLDNDACKALAYWLYDRFGPVERKLHRPQPGNNPFGAYQPAAQRRTTLLPGGERGSVRFGRGPAEPKGKPPLSFEVAHEQQV